MAPRFLLLVAGFLSLNFLATTLVGQDVDQSVLDSVVNVIAYRRGNIRTGTGFVIDDKIDDRLTIVTNHHVVSGAETVVVRFRTESKPYQCDLVDDIEGLDLAALRVRGTPTVKPKSLNTEDPSVLLKLLQEVVLIGQMVFNQGVEGLKLPWTTHSGKVSAVKRKRSDIVKNGPNQPDAEVFQLDLTTAHGMSGSPILNDRNRVVGVLFAGVDYGVANVSFGVPHKYLGDLNLRATARPFSGQGRTPVAQAGGGVRMLSAQGPLMQMFAGQNDNPGAEAFTVNVGAMNWGVVFGNPDFIRDRYVADRERFAQHIPAPVLIQIMQKRKLFHITNPYFRFSALVPDNFAMKETVPDDIPDALITDFICNQYPRPLDIISVETHKISIPGSGDALARELGIRSQEFLRLGLGLKLVGSPDPPGAPPPNDIVAVVPEFSDPAPRIHDNGRAIRFWRTYRSLDIRDRDYTFMYGIIDDVFVVAHFAVDRRRLALFDNSDFVEKILIVSSLSFSD